VPRLSGVDIAELVASCAHSISNPDRRRVDTKVDKIVKRGVSRWGEVENGVCTSNSVLAILQVLVLPDPPSSIDLSVVQEEVWVTRRGIEVTARIASNPKVTTSVYAKVTRWKITLHPVLEAENIGAIGDELVCGICWSAKLILANQKISLTADRIG
jgi:hypothetical protein